MGAAASSSSSSSSTLDPRKYDVFISFRGEDTRFNFTSHLHAALCQKGITTYIDYNLPRGEEIKQSLMQAIQDSSISVVVFSEKYASSKWCLNELVKIIECKRDQGQVVIPVFYKVDPSHVRHQEGTYKEKFEEYERDSMLDQQLVNMWKHALFETANLAGWDSRTCLDESEFIRNIVNNILRQMKLGYPTALKGLVGINENCDYIERLLERVPIIGIWGMGGIGKTTMARVIFAKLASQFEACCFLENVSEQSDKHGLRYILDKLLFELLKEETNPYDQVIESTFAMRRLRSKKVFIVLDDVSSSHQLEYLARDYDGLGQDSRVIITTRDKHLLVGKVNEIHEAKALSYYKSLQLFNLKAFHSDYPKAGYEELAKKTIDYAKGIPLAIIVLGSFLYSKTIKEWEDELAKLKKTPNNNIQKVLKLSFDGLNNEEKEIFLDIAFFLKGEDEVSVITLLQNFGFHASIGLRTLADNALISSIGGTVWMHELIQEMGCEIVRQESTKEPGKRSRLCDPKEVYSVLKNNTGTDAIEGITLDLSRIRDVNLSADTFKKMTKLRFLKFYSPWHRRSSKMQLPFGLESLSDTLRYLQWDKYPLASLPSTFCPEKLVELCMQDSLLTKLWDGVQDFVNLRSLDLAGSKQLIELPDFSKAQNLQKVDLSSCEKLCYVHQSILSLQKLVTLNLNKCIKLKNLQSENHLKSLRYLYVSWCLSLREFSLWSEEIQGLQLETTSIELLDSSIGRLCKLVELGIDGSRLRNLPINDLCHLRSLQVLRLSNCVQVIDKLKLHILFEALKSLQRLYLDGCYNLTELPNNIKHLSKLQVLSIKNCMNLQSLPELPPLIEELDATNCTSLESLLTSQVGFSVGHLTKLRKLRFHVSILKNFSIDQLCCLISLREVTLFDCRHVIDKEKLHMLFDAVSTLEDLYLEGCSNLYELPDNVSALSSLFLLALEGSNVQSLPSTIKHVSKLDYIYLTNCRRLGSIPELPPFTKYVKATNCISLETAFPLTTSRPRRKYLVESLFLENCFKLNEQSVSCIEEYAHFSLKRGAYINRIGAFCYPGSRVPKWYGHIQPKEASSSVTIELSLALNNLVGFIFCSVLPQFSSKQNCRSYLRCQCYFEDGEVVQRTGKDMDVMELNSYHVFQWYDPVYNTYILQELLTREEDQGTTYNLTLSFQFSVITYNNENYEITEHDGLIEACGVCPIYASEYHIFLQQMEMQLERDQAIDEHSLCGIMEYASFSLKPAKRGDLETSIIPYPEIIIPQWFSHRSSTTQASILLSKEKKKTQASILVDLFLDFEYLVGFTFCFLIPQFSSGEKYRSHSGCRCYFRNSDNLGVEGPRGWHYSLTELNKNNVFLWYDPLFCEIITEKFRRERGKINIEEGTNDRARISFEFEFGECLIKECGVRPIYASEYNDFLQQMKLNEGRKTKRPRDTNDEEEQLTPTKKLKESSKSMASQNINELQLSLSKLKLNSSGST